MSQGADGAARADCAGSRSRERDGSPASGGEDAVELGNVKDKQREKSKMKGKVIRLLTVMAYVLSVSLAAIMLSLYYVFLWDPKMPSGGAITRRLQAAENDALGIAVHEALVVEALRHEEVKADAAQNVSAERLQAHALQAPALEMPAALTDGPQVPVIPANDFEAPGAHVSVLQVAPVPPHDFQAQPLEETSMNANAPQVSVVPASDPAAPGTHASALQVASVPPHDLQAQPLEEPSVHADATQIPVVPARDLEAPTTHVDALQVHAVQTSSRPPHDYTPATHEGSLKTHPAHEHASDADTVQDALQAAILLARDLKGHTTQDGGQHASVTTAKSIQGDALEGSSLHDKKVHGEIPHGGDQEGSILQAEAGHTKVPALSGPGADETGSGAATTTTGSSFEGIA